MQSLLESVAFVNAQLTFQRNMAAKFAKDPKRAARHIDTAQQFAELLALIQAAIQQMAVAGTERPKKKPNPLFLSLDEVSDLPKELVDELSFSESDKTEYAILRIVEECGGVASIDRILFSLFKKTGEVLKRSTLTSRLYRMVQKEQLFAVPSKKGVYADRQLTQEESDNLT